MDFILLRSFDSYIDAHLMMGRMEEEGIKCWLKDEYTVTTMPVWSNAVGGIKLMVADSQIERAQEILQKLEAEKRLSFACPHCGSHNIEFINTPGKAANWLSALVTWFLGSYAIAVEQIWHCFDCGKEFESPVEMNNSEAYKDESYQ